MGRKTSTWQNALLATCGLAAVMFAATLLWQAGHPQWSFALAFAAIWTLISISWSHVDFAEHSGNLLAGIVDHNFDQVHERLLELEREVEILRASADRPY